MASPYADAVFADTPVGYWRLTDPSGTEALDQIAGANGTYVGGPTLGMPGPTQDDDTAAVLFNGVDQHVQLPAGTGYAPAALFAFEAIFRTSNASSLMAIVAYSHDANDVNRCYMGVNAGKPYLLQARQGTAEITGDNNVADGQWHHMVGLFRTSGVGRELWVDGVKVGEDVTNTAGFIQATRSIGMVPQLHPIAYWDGELAEVAQYDGWLSEARIQAHHAAAFGDDGGPTIRTPRMLRGMLRGMRRAS